VKIFSLAIQNFRGIRSTKLVLPDHAVLIGDNNTGKSSVFEAIDLALGPDRLSRRPPVDEHDFYQGKYRAVVNPEAPQGAEADIAPKITVEVTITNLSPNSKPASGRTSSG
jgi:putative ATP-dependent endonuclease of the OLD family